MTRTLVTLDRLNEDDPTALWHHYSGQLRHQDVFVELDLRDGHMTVDYSGEVGNAVPVAVWNGEVRRYALAAVPTTAGANRLLQRLAPLAQRVLDDSTQVYNARRGQNLIAVGEEGASSEADIAEVLAEIDAPDYGREATDLVAVWALEALNAPEWYDGITADISDAGIAEITNAVLADMAADCGAGAAVCDGLYEHLIDYRDTLRADQAETTHSR